MRVRLTAGAIFIALLGVAAALAPSANAESTPSAYGSRLVTLINQARAQHGLRALMVAGGTSTVAASWTSHMAQQQALSHNPNLGAQLESHGSPNWKTYAENVADASTSSADAMFQNYMNSPEHRSNILDSHMRYVGVGVVFTGSLAWNTLDFVDQYNSTSPTSTSTRTTTTTKPKTTAQAPRTATRTAPKTVTAVRTTTKRVAQPARAAAPPAPPAVPARHTAKPRPVTQKPAVVRPASAPVAPAAHVMAAPSPVALTTTPVHGGREGHTLALVAAFGILFVAASRLMLRRSLRTR